MSEGLGEWDDELEDTSTETSGQGENDEDAPELFYPNVAEFVSNKLAISYRRQLNVQGGVTWCPQWWKHAEAISRLEALWRAWEFLRLDGTTGMSVWWRDHADHHMSVLLSADGPFKGCTPDDGHRTKLTPLPCEEPPPGLF
ncbi:DUF4913 domain-containing protein [Pseudarthrobacter sp. LMD1-1-1.1]|uniref:DUF4913 domain-containing protein n=1 Tax=Pseudarthrobacter sp. LMD1-1-1.1 TaxID=3135242 RepID=UPI00343355C6